MSLEETTDVLRNARKAVPVISTCIVRHTGPARLPFNSFYFQQSPHEGATAHAYPSWTRQPARLTYAVIELTLVV